MRKFSRALSMYINYGEDGIGFAHGMGCRDYADCFSCPFDDCRFREWEGGMRYTGRNAPKAVLYVDTNYLKGQGVLHERER